MYIYPVVTERLCAICIWGLCQNLQDSYFKGILEFRDLCQNEGKINTICTVLQCTVYTKSNEKYTQYVQRKIHPE